MRRTPAALAVTVIAAALVFLVPLPSFAVDAPPPPVAAVPDLPSRAVKTNVGSPVKLAELWQSMRYTAGMAGSVTAPSSPTSPSIATAPKPITAASTFARGAAGGPLLAAFTGGFTIGTAGLGIYGQITGDDPLEGICGSGFEGIGSVIYMGMMPNCTATIDAPNVDAGEGFTPLTVGGVSVTYTHTWISPTQGANWYDAFCYTGSGSIPSGHVVEGLDKFGVWNNVGMPGAGGSWGCPGSRFHYKVNSYGNGVLSTPTLRLRNTATGSIVSQMTELTANPTRTAKCRIGWEDGTTTTGVGSSYTEADGFPLSTAGTGCEKAFVSKPGAGPDLMPSRIEVESDNGGSITTIADQPVPSMTTPEREAMKDTGNNTGLVLTKVVGTTADSCMTWAADCAGWWPATSEGTTPNTGPAEYRCTFNGSAVSLAECGVYRNTFDTKTSTPTITDPQTGQSQPWQSSNPSNTVNPSIPTPGTNGNCMDAWASLNPIDWVLVPVKCALQWAFVPSPANITAAQTNITGAWEGSTFGALAASMVGLGDIFDANTGCGGLPFDFAAFGVVFEGQLFESCSEPMAGVASVVRNIASGVIIVGGVLAIMRYGAGVFGFVGLGMGVGDRQDSGGGVRFK